MTAPTTKPNGRAHATRTRTPAPQAAAAPAAPDEVLPARIVHGTASTLEAIQEELPERNWPVVAGAGALVLLGAVDWPVAVGGTVLYLAFKNWRFPHRG